MDDDGIALPTGRYFFTLDGENASKEHFSCTLTGVNLTNLKSISRQGVETTGAVRTHRIGATASLTDFAHLFYFNSLLNGTSPYSALVPLSYDGATSITLPNQFATKAYVDGVAIAGAPNANATTKGLVEEATQAEVDAGTTAGSTGADLFTRPDTLRSKLISDYVIDAGAVNTYVITPLPAITTYTAGQVFSFKALVTNTGASTLNVSGLGAKTITKAGGLTALAAGDVIAGQIVQVEYDGVNFQLISGMNQASALQSVTTSVNVSAASAPTANQVLTATNGTAATWKTPATSFRGLIATGITTYSLTTASGTLNIPHGLGFVPVSYKVMAANNGHFGFGISFNNTTLSTLGGGFGSAFTIGGSPTGSDSQTGTITVDATNIKIAWVKTGSPTETIFIMWEAFA